jgi:cytochrome c oxidase subunit 2
VRKFFVIALIVITLVSTAVFILRVWWLPPDMSVLGPGIDRQLNETMLSAGVLFVLAQLTLAVFVWQSGGGSTLRKITMFPGGATPMVVLATALVGFEILALTLVGTKIWANIFLSPAPADALHVDVQAGQFAFYFRYPGPDGKFGVPHPELIDEGAGNFFGLDPAHDTAARDDIVTATLGIPVNRPILLTMHAKDVIHSFDVPELRLQQDIVPGMIIPLHFTATQVARKEIVCTQLCGLGHYNMKAYLQVMPQAEFDKWLKDQAAQQ